jgi:hypothetical protein
LQYQIPLIMKTLRYFYHPDHPDHLGSTSWVTDSAKNGVQYCEYLPYGEPFIDQRGAAAIPLAGKSETAKRATPTSVPATTTPT